jgi:hypothetical protein
MVDLTTNQAIIIAAISASSAIIGGLIGAEANYIFELQSGLCFFWHAYNLNQYLL